ncbi:hypothetical protein RD792_006761 [Penstemon davidsonii]|uniref:Kinesin-like protein n=1 Tax=Penstemon davidsonii TaxID=160366 RepID=A0ABR0DCY7_9LAMI|nr:hypothetical protein RD792_006761 [Penstemon davidsonii]
MEDFEWHDPLHITDDSSLQQQNQTHCESLTSVMELADDSSPTKIDGRSVLGFSLTSPDLVICVGSPDITKQRFEESSPDFLRGERIDVSLENGIEGSEIRDSFNTPVEKTEDLSTRVSFELIAQQPFVEEKLTKTPTSESRIDAGDFEGVELSERMESPYMPQCEILNGIEDCSIDEEFNKLQREHALQKKELFETKRFVEELKIENEHKSRECQEAWKSLKELQNELMRKSMHVGSLAFAIEGQVKEKSKWFSLLRDITRKLKILKMDQIRLLEEASLFKNYLVDVEGVGTIVQSTMKKQVQLNEDIKIKFLQEVKQKKELYNKVLELKGNIRVFCRCRPFNSEEITSGATTAVEFEGAKDGELTVKSNGISKKTFKFDAVFSPEADQVEVFEETAPLAISVLDGYNVCIFAYGQTGSGKTFTMEGTNEARGVNYRTLENLFNIIEERKNTFKYEVSVSVLEVYNEQIRDLLVSSGSSQTTKRLEIKQVVGEGGGHHVPGLVEAQVNNVNEVWEVLRTGSNGRVVESTNANEHSSRSHCMHCVMVKGENLVNGECTKSKLWLVDLAGSERIARTEVQGERLKETQNINRSLSALGDVISSLATKSPHIPFRNSKLTHLLQDSLGGDSKTLMFVQISPNENDLTESLCSLNFASRVRGIELGPAKKQMDNTEILKYKQMIEKLRQDLKSKDNQVKKMEDTNYGLEVKLKERDIKNRNLQDKIKELESQLLVERKLARQHVDSRIKQQHVDSEATRAPLAEKSIEGYSTNNIDSITLLEKENNPNIAPQHLLLLPKQTGRASLCPTLRKISNGTTAPRRNSLIPLPNSLTSNNKSSFVPLNPIQANKSEDANEARVCDEKSKMLRRKSIQKRSQRVGVNVGMEKLRVSIGGRGKNGQRMLLGNARRAVTSINNHREKERGWNSGTAARTL